MVMEGQAGVVVGLVSQGIQELGVRFFFCVVILQFQYSNQCQLFYFKKKSFVFKQERFFRSRCQVSILWVSCFFLDLLLFGICFFVGWRGQFFFFRFLNIFLKFLKGNYFIVNVGGNNEFSYIRCQVCRQKVRKYLVGECF